MNIKLNRLTLIGMPTLDVLYLNTNLPCGTFPFHGEATIRLDIAKGTGKKYCETNFPGVPINMINCE